MIVEPQNRVDDHVRAPCSVTLYLVADQCGPVVTVLALRSGDPGFKTSSNHPFNLFLVDPGSTSQLHL